MLTIMQYTIQPTENDCPINTASVSAASAASVATVMSTSAASVASVATAMSISAASVASVGAAMSISTASVASVATAFNPEQTTLSCGQKYGPDTGLTYPSVPRAQTNDILHNAAVFCTPSKSKIGNPLVLNKGQVARQIYQFKGPDRFDFYEFFILWDPRRECANVFAPEISDALPSGPDYACNTYFDALTNTCDAGPGEDKNGGVMYANCVIWSWQTLVEGHR